MPERKHSFFQEVSSVKKNDTCIGSKFVCGSTCIVVKEAKGAWGLGEVSFSSIFVHASHINLAVPPYFGLLSVYFSLS